MTVSGATDRARRVAAWATEVVVTAPALARAQRPGGTLDARTRVRLGIAVAEAFRAPGSAWVLASWAEFLGEAAGDDLDVALAGLAADAARTRRPTTGDDLAAAVPATTVAAARGVIAVAVVAAEAERSALRTIARLRRRLPLRGPGGYPATLADAVAGAVALPAGVAAMAAGAAARALARAAPPLPSVEGPPPEAAGLLTAVLVQAVPSYLAGTGPRFALAALPVVVAVGVRSGRAGATVRVGAGRIEVRDGIDDDVVAIIEGDAEPLLALAAGAVTRELAALRLRR